MFGRFFVQKDTEKKSSEYVNSDTLKQANEELYKQSAELAVKNKTLSLLDSLYSVVTKALDIDDVGKQVTKEILRGFSAVYSAIILFDKENNSFELIGFADQKNTQSYIPKGVRITNKKYEGFHLLKQDEPFYVLPPYSSVHGFFPHHAMGKALDDLGIVQELIFPLSTDGVKTGLLVFGLNRDEQKLTAFEREGIMSTVHVVSVAIDKTKAYTELKLANQKLRDLDKLKTEFISIASHQLRTPLSIIKGYVSLMQENAFGKLPKTVTPILKNIEESNERLVKLVDDFLDVSRLEQGRTKYSFEECDVLALFQSLIKELSEKAKGKSITLDVHVGKTFPKTAIVDEDRIRHAAFNLLDNAIKYSPKRSKITIDIAKKFDRISYRVLDQGVGMDEEDIRNLFQKFYRSPKVLREFEGTGLGLFVVKEFVEAHGGQVLAKSDGVGKGSEFSFWIPTIPEGEVYQEWKLDHPAAQKAAVDLPSLPDRQAAGQAGKKKTSR